VNYLLLSLMGGFLALDGTSVGQFMVSRPLVAGIVAGWVVGDPALGLLIGGVLEAYFISMFPVGGAVFPEGGPATVVGVVAGAQLGGAPGLAVGVLIGLLWSRLSAWSIRLLRRINGRLVPDPTATVVTPRKVATAHLAGVGIDFARGAILTFAGLVGGAWVASTLGPHWPLDGNTTLGLLAVGASVPAGAFVASLGGWRRRRFLLALGFLGALALGWML
jgi:PTS system mannose-specific IIC component